MFWTDSTSLWQKPERGLLPLLSPELGSRLTAGWFTLKGKWAGGQRACSSLPVTFKQGLCQAMKSTDHKA